LHVFGLVERERLESIRDHFDASLSRVSDEDTDTIDRVVTDVVIFRRSESHEDWEQLLDKAFGAVGTESVEHVAEDADRTCFRAGVGLFHESCSCRQNVRQTFGDNTLGIDSGNGDEKLACAIENFSLDF
jgi:hypothetical protein